MRRRRTNEEREMGDWEGGGGVNTILMQKNKLCSGCW